MREYVAFIAFPALLPASPVPTGDPQIEGGSSGKIQWILPEGGAESDDGIWIGERTGCCNGKRCCSVRQAPAGAASPSESPRHLCSRQDESVIVGYYTLKKCFPRPAGHKKRLKRRSDDGKK